MQNLVVLTFFLIAGASAAPSLSSRLIPNIFGGLIGDVGNIVDGYLDTDGNVSNQLFETLDNIYNAVVNAPGTAVNSDGIIYDVVGNTVDSTGKLTGNIFNAIGNVFEQTTKVVDGLVGNVTQITGTILNPKMKVMAGLADIISNIVQRLGETTSNFPTVSNLNPNLINTGTDIETMVQSFFTKTIPQFNDFIVTVALKTSQTNFTIFTDTIKQKINGIVNITSTLDKFSSDLKNSVAQQINKVTDLTLNLAKQIKSAALLNAVAMNCAYDFRSVIIIFSKVSIPYITECLESVPSPMDATSFTDKSQAAVKYALAQTKDLVASLEACVAPPLANKTSTALKEDARACLITVGTLAKTKLVTIVDTFNGIIALYANMAGVSDCFALRGEKADNGASIISEMFNNCISLTNDD